VARNGAIDWLCWPRLDSDACLAALLGEEKHGSWRLAPASADCKVTRCYREGTLILDTRHETASGIVTVTDLMPVTAARRTIIRRVNGQAGTVNMLSILTPRFDFGRRVPWLRAEGCRAIAAVGPDLLSLQCDVPLRTENGAIIADFAVSQGETVAFALQHSAAFGATSFPIDIETLITGTEHYWRKWIARFDKAMPWSEAVRRSLITLQALVHADSGGTIAAPTLGLPEVPQGQANWDYRYSWLRDSTFILSAFLHAGFTQEARIWRDWLLRAIAGDAAETRIMYRFDGGIHIAPDELPWLPGYEGAQPVRLGNAAATQNQLDVYGEVLNALHFAEEAGLDDDRPWDISVEDGLIDQIEKVWQRPDQGIWESRDEPQHFTHSKVMCWVGIKRFLNMTAARNKLQVPRRQALAQLGDRIHADICSRAFDKAQNTFVSAYGSREIDASLLRLPLVGFLPASDPRVCGTIAAIERELVEDSLVRRWPRGSDKPDEGAFLACTCWLADCLAMQGRDAEAQAYFERVLAVRNDLGLLAEEWNCRERHLMGNFPQAFSHVALINTALRLSGAIPG
jgi:GH15 family glucan-1,4-alpha-glucosidase